jgi:hypothetical protein
VRNKRFLGWLMPNRTARRSLKSNLPAQKKKNKSRTKVENKEETSDLNKLVVYETFVSRVWYDLVMSFEDLRHTPDFELPPNAPEAPADLLSLIEECHEGLHKAMIHKMVRRGKYESIATIICQENPNKKTRPTASAEDIADYCMMCMQYEIDKSDDPGSYRVMLIGPPGRGRFERSKHVELGDGDGMARSKTMMTEAELVDAQGQYIGELHSQIVAMSETVHSMIKPLLQENKEMMKIVSDASRKQAEIEREKMRHELELKMHNDQIKLEEAKEEMKSERWRETMDVIKESGAIEGVMKAVLKKMNQRKDDDDDDDEEEEEEATTSSSASSDSSGSSSQGNETPKTAKKSAKKKSSKLEKAKSKSGRPKFKKRKKAKPSPKNDVNLKQGTIDAIEKGEEMTQEQLAEVFEQSGLKKAQDNPTAIMVEILKMMIDEKDQWGIIEQTLSKEQMVVFKKIMESGKDSVIHKLLKELYEMKGARRLLKLEQHLDEEQQKYIDKLLEIAMSD